MTKNLGIPFVSSSVVSDELRTEFLPFYLGKHFVRGESMAYDWASRLSSDYKGGSWIFLTLSNGGFYMAPEADSPVHVRWHLNSYDDTMSSDAFGVVVMLFVLCHLSELTGVETMIESYYRLREYATTHAEAGKILRAID